MFLNYPQHILEKCAMPFRDVKPNELTRRGLRFLPVRLKQTKLNRYRTFVVVAWRLYIIKHITSAIFRKPAARQARLGTSRCVAASWPQWLRTTTRVRCSFERADQPVRSGKVTACGPLARRLGPGFLALLPSSIRVLSGFTPGSGPARLGPNPE